MNPGKQLYSKIVATLQQHWCNVSRRLSHMYNIAFSQPCGNVEATCGNVAGRLPLNSKITFQQSCGNIAERLLQSYKITFQQPSSDVATTLLGDWHKVMK